MSRRIPFSSAMLIALAAAAISLAEDTRVVISVEKPKANLVEAGKPPFAGQRPAVDVAILLDTSNSMDGLIDQAKSQLWTIVQQFAKAKKSGPDAGAARGAVRIRQHEPAGLRRATSARSCRSPTISTSSPRPCSPSRPTAATSTAGRSSTKPIKRLDWSKEPNGYKAIFIAGNEPFTQGPVDYHKACKRAIERGIVVNTIHCGSRARGHRRTDGRTARKLAEGESFNIDQDRAVVQIDCPQDEIIIKLNAELNKTYLWYGDGERSRSLRCESGRPGCKRRGAGAGSGQQPQGSPKPAPPTATATATWSIRWPRTERF